MGRGMAGRYISRITQKGPAYSIGDNHQVEFRLNVVAIT